MSITEAAGHRGGGAGGGHGVLDGSGRTEIALSDSARASVAARAERGGRDSREIAPLGLTVSLEWGGAARSVSPHGVRISCARRGVRWAGLSSVCLCVTGVAPKNHHFLDFGALVFAVPGPRSARFDQLGGLRVDMVAYLLREPRMSPKS